MTFFMFAAAIGSGVTGTVFASKGFRKRGYGAAAIAAYAVATYMIALLLQRLPVGIVYVVWTGAAAVLLFVDQLVFRVKTRTPQLLGTALTVVGVALLGTAANA